MCAFMCVCLGVCVTGYVCDWVCVCLGMCVLVCVCLGVSACVFCEFFVRVFVFSAIVCWVCACVGFTQSPQYHQRTPQYRDLSAQLARLYKVCQNSLSLSPFSLSLTNFPSHISLFLLARPSATLTSWRVSTKMECV